MKRGNVLVIGNSGVGKSTLINAVIGEERAKTGWGTEGKTDRLDIYESELISFRIIDTVGFEPSFIKEQVAINAVKKWSKNSAKEGNEDTQINVIWFCVDGTSRKLFSKAIQDLSKATSQWPSVPVIVAITKSYSEQERIENIQMVNTAFASQKRFSKNLRKVIPVVASIYILNETAYAPQIGITELIDATNELMPEGLKASEKDVASFKLNRKRAMAHSTVGITTTSAAIVGAIPIPFSDAVLLAPIEMGLINTLAQIYGINKNEDYKKFMTIIIEVGTVGSVAKLAISGLKAIPGVNLAAGVINAVIAGCIVTALGEGTIYIFEKVYTGEKSIEDIDWVRKVMDSKISSELLDTMNSIVEKIASKTNNQSNMKVVLDIISEFFKSNIKTTEKR